MVGKQALLVATARRALGVVLAACHFVVEVTLACGCLSPYSVVRAVEMVEVVVLKACECCHSYTTICIVVETWRLECLYVCSC